MVDETVRDPLGREIALHDRTWFGHILKGHPDVEGHREFVRGAISSPEEIRISRSDSDCRLYYGPSARESVKMVVVVDIAESVVKTAHLAKRIAGGVFRMAVVTDTLEGVIDQKLWYHYDLTGDVLYLRLAEDRESPTTAEEGEDGVLRLRREDDDEIVGLTVVNWWKNQHGGELPDSIREFERLIENWRRKIDGSELT